MKRSLLIILSIAAALITLFIAISLAPWYSAINTRVRLHYDAPADAKISVCWDDDRSQCLPLVPFSSKTNMVAESGEISNLWMSELPPRPVYTISLIFTTAINQPAFHELELDSTKVLMFGSSLGTGVGNLHFPLDQFDLSKGEGDESVESNSTQCNNDCVIRLLKKIIPDYTTGSKTVESTLKIWGLLFSMIIVIASPFLLLPDMVSNLYLTTANSTKRKYPWWVFFVFGTVASLMIWIVVNSGLILNEYDPLGYLYLSLGRGWFNDARLPGYPLFLGLALEIFQNSMSGVIFLQAFVFVLSVFIFLWSLRRWIHPIAAVIFIVLCFLSPAQIHWARWILRESLFTSLMLIGISTVIAHFTSPKPHSKIWLWVFTVIYALAFLVRENGILLPVALLPVLIPEAIKHLTSPNLISNKLRSIFFLGLRYIGPVLIVLAIYFGFSTYNYLHYGYFQVGLHQTSHAFLAKTIFTANSDARSLINPTKEVSNEAKNYHGLSLYHSYILARDQTPGLDPVYMALYPSVQRVMTENGEPANSFHIAEVLNEIGKEMYSQISWQSNLSGFLRQYREIITLRNPNSSYPLIVVDSSVFTHVQQLIAQWPQNVHITIDEVSHDENSPLVSYYRLTQSYPWYGGLLILALLSCYYIGKYEDPVFLAPAAVFIANSLLLLATRLVSYRYLVSLDVLLIMQFVLGLSLWINRKFPSIKSVAQQPLQN